MSVTKIPVTNRLRIRWNTGLDAEMNPVFRNRSWSGVKPEATADDLHALGVFIDQICVHTADSIRVEELYELED